MSYTESIKTLKSLLLQHRNLAKFHYLKIKDYHDYMDDFFEEHYLGFHYHSDRIRTIEKIFSTITC